MKKRKISFGLDTLKSQGPKSCKLLVPPEIAIYLTGSCEAKCKHCIIWRKFSGHYLSLSILKRFFKEMNKLGIPFVCFTGGEPFDYEDGIFNVVKEAIKNDIFINQIITNASFAKEKNLAIEILKSLKKSGFKAIKLQEGLLLPTLTISMDKEHQRFIPIENIKNLVKAARNVYGEEINITINIVIFPDNNGKNFEKEKLIKKYEWLSEVDHINVSPLAYEGDFEKNKTSHPFLVSDNLQNWNTPCNWFSTKYNVVPAVFPNGDFNFCCFFNLYLTLGNIYHDSLKHCLEKASSMWYTKMLLNFGPIEIFKELSQKIAKIKELLNERTYGKCGFCKLLAEKIIECT